ncbi:MAG: hypothetical protein QMB08_00845 [Acidimicrobiales bacterium]
MGSTRCGQVELSGTHVGCIDEHSFVLDAFMAPDVAMTMRPLIVVLRRETLLGSVE